MLHSCISLARVGRLHHWHSRSLHALTPTMTMTMTAHSPRSGSVSERVSERVSGRTITTRPHSNTHSHSHTKTTAARYCRIPHFAPNLSSTHPLLHSLIHSTLTKNTNTNNTTATMKFDVTVARRGVDIHKWLQRNNLLEVELSGDKSGTGTGSGSGSEYTCECVGFDVEWKPSWRKGQARNCTALLQLGTLSSALLVQLKHFAPVDKRDLEDALMATSHYSSEEVSERRGRDKGSVRSKRREKLPASILRLLASERVVKVGVGVLEDLSKLQDDFGTPIGAFRDVGLTAHRALGLEKFGLVGLTSHCFGVELHKPKSVSRSDWERSELSNNQIHYAALDAIVSRYIFSALEEKKIISEVEDKNAEALMLRELQREGPSRRCFRRAVLVAAENNFLFASLHSFIREEELQPHRGSVATLSRLQDLKTYCERVNTSAEVKVVLRAASCVMISVFLNGVTVKSYCVGGGVLLKKDKKLLENKLCEEVLSDLMILQRNCTGNLTYSLLSIFAGVPVHKLPIHQLQESGSRQPQISSAVASTGTISAQDNSSVIPSYVRAYCRQHSSRVVI